MYFFPYARRIFRSRLQAGEMHRRLAFVLDKERWIRTPFNDDLSKVFIGKGDEKGFKMMRIIRYRNSFAPVMKGKYVPDSDGTSLVVTARMHMGVIIFGVLWCMICIGGLIGTVYSALNGGPPGVALIPLIMLLLFWFASSYFMHLERRRSEKVLEKIWEGRFAAL